MDERTERLAELVHRAAVADDRYGYDFDSLINALPHLTREQLARAFVEAMASNPEDRADLVGLSRDIADLAAECCIDESDLKASVFAIRRVLTGLYREGDAAEERARNIAGSLREPDEGAYASIQGDVLLRHLVHPITASDLKTLAVRIIAAHLATTWKVPPDHLEQRQAMIAYGVSVSEWSVVEWTHLEGAA